MKEAPNHGSDEEITETNAKKPIPRGLTTTVQEQVIDERKQDTEDNRHLITLNRWDNSDVFYETRRRLDGLGYDVRFLSKSRKSMSKHVKDYCDELGIKRHEIGIFAADRAVLAFQGRLHSVSFENYPFQSKKYPFIFQT